VSVCVQCSALLSVNIASEYPSLLSNRHHLSHDDCLEDKRENYQNCSVELSSCSSSLLVWFRFSLVCLFVFSILCVFCFSLDYFVLVLFAFVVLGLVSSVVRQDIGWEEHFRNDLFCVEWDIKP